MALMAVILFRSSCTETYGGLCKDSYSLHQLVRSSNLGSNKQTKQDVIVKTAPDFLFRNERNILKRFQTISSLRRLIDEVQDPPLLVLEYLDSNLLIESATKKTSVFRSQVRCKGYLTSSGSFARRGYRPYGYVKSHGYNILLYNT